MWSPILFAMDIFPIVNWYKNILFGSGIKMCSEICLTGDAPFMQSTIWQIEHNNTNVMQVCIHNQKGEKTWMSEKQICVCVGMNVLSKADNTPDTAVNW